MYYKIINKDCEVYKALYALRAKELTIEKENREAIISKTGSDFKDFIGDTGQQNFRRVPIYGGFKFKNPEKINLKAWKQDPVNKGFFIPNRRTKDGREMAEFLLNGLKSSYYQDVFDILNVGDPRIFKFPYVEIVGDIIILYIDERFPLTDDNIIEITRPEFSNYLKPSK